MLKIAEKLGFLLRGTVGVWKKTGEG